MTSFAAADIAANIALLERKFGRPLPNANVRDLKVSLSISALISIVQAARDEERQDEKLRIAERKAAQAEAAVNSIWDLVRGKK